MDLKQAEQIWNILPHLTSDHVIRLMARKGEKLVGDFASRPSEIKRFADACEGMNCYVSLNPTTRKDGIRHNAEDCTHWSWLVFDLDPISDVASPAAALDKILAHFGGLTGRDLFKYPPTVVDSGRGYQAWLHGEDLELGENLPRTKVRKVMSYWIKRISDRLGMIHGCKLDTSCTDLPRVMRLPFTVNQKTGRMSTILKVQDENYQWLFPFLIAGTPAEVLVEKPVTSVGGKWQFVFNRLTLSAQNYLMKGKEEPGRHQTVWHVAKSLMELGISREETEKAITRANRLKGEEQQLSDGEITHCLDTAFANIS